MSGEIFKKAGIPAFAGRVASLKLHSIFKALPATNILANIHILGAIISSPKNEKYFYC